MTSALHDAIYANDFPLVRAILDAKGGKAKYLETKSHKFVSDSTIGFYPSRVFDSVTPLVHAAHLNNRSDILRYLLESGADVNSQESRAYPGDYGGYPTTALWCACSTGDEKKVELLLEYGADVELGISGTRYGTPMEGAIGHHDSPHIGVMQILFEHGATLEKVTDQGVKDEIVASANRKTDATHKKPHLQSQANIPPAGGGGGYNSQQRSTEGEYSGNNNSKSQQQDGHQIDAACTSSGKFLVSRQGRVHTWLENEVYTGETKSGVYHGLGTFRYDDGKTFKGEWKDGKRHGQGVMTYHDGATFKGQYVHGECQGSGTYTTSSGGTLQVKIQNGTQFIAPREGLILATQENLERVLAATTTTLKRELDDKDRALVNSEKEREANARKLSSLNRDLVMEREHRVRVEREHEDRVGQARALNCALLKEREERAREASTLNRDLTGLRGQLVSSQQAAEERIILEGLYRVAAGFSLGRGKPNPLPNPVAVTSQAGTLFCRGLSMLGYGGIRDLLDHSGHFTVGFHGTGSEDAICGIFKEGFDPMRRSGQRYGRGEYFDIGHGAVAGGFNGNTDCLIVAVIVTKARDGATISEYTEKAQYHGQPNTPFAIVDNPKPPTTGGSDPISDPEVATGPPPYAFNIPCAVASDQSIKGHVERKIRQHFITEFSVMEQ